MNYEIDVCVLCGENNREFDRKKSNYICIPCNYKLKIIKQLEIVDKAIKDLKSSKTTYEIMTASRKGLFKEAEIKVKKKVKEGMAFGSKCEAIIALELEREGTAYISQKKIGKNVVDFMLPNDKIIIEVDGSLYHTDEDRDFLRDREVMRDIGEEWEIIRITEDLIPGYVVTNLTESLHHVITQRIEQKRFRDSRNDSFYIQEFVNLQAYLRRCKNE